MEEKKQQLHVIMVPWLAYGHIRPFLELAKRLHDEGLKVSFLSTPLNIRWIRQYISQLHPIPHIDLLEIPLPSIDGLPDGVESTADLKRGGTFELLIKAMDEWEKPFEALLERLSPDFVIHDMTQYWASPMAAKLGIPTIFFHITSAASAAFFKGHDTYKAENGVTVQDLTGPPPGFPSAHICLSAFSARKILQVHTNKEERITTAQRWSMCLQGSWLIAFNTCVELEGKYLDYLKTIQRQPVLPVGIIMPDLPPSPAADRSLAWLELQLTRSVVVVSFGSECILTRQELVALALGLEESEVPFLCILLRQMAAELPQGFVERTQSRGLVVIEWAPQLHILSHSSVGAFFTQCGWNSVTEGLRFGVPLLTIPLQHEQFLNSKLIADDLMLGVEVRRNEEDGSFSKEDVTKAVRRLMEEEEGREIRSNLRQLSGLLTSDDRQIYRSSIHNFVSLLKEKAS